MKQSSVGTRRPIIVVAKRSQPRRITRPNTATPAPVGPNISVNFLSYLVATILVAGVVSVVEQANIRAAWSIVALVLIGILLVQGGQTMLQVANLMRKLQFK